jgi:PAS domain S-box-containing protein
MRPTVLLFRQLFSSRAKNLGIALLVLAGGLTLTVSRAYLLNKYFEKGGEEKLELYCKDIQERIVEKLESQARLLSYASSLIRVSDTTTREEWHLFMEESGSVGFPSGIQGVGYAVIVQKQHLNNHLQQIRKEGFPEYDIRPKGERACYIPVIFIEPFSGRNLRAFGYDMNTDSSRRETFERSRDTGLPLITTKVMLLQETETDPQNGILMYLPVYKKNMPVQTTYQRREAIVGWVYSPIRMNDLINSLLKYVKTDSLLNVVTEVYESTLSENKLLFTNKTEHAPVYVKQNFLKKSNFINYYGRTWTISMAQNTTSSPYFNKITTTALLWGSILSFALFVLSLSLLNTRKNALKIAETLTNKLNRSELRLRLAMMGANEVGWEFNPHTGTLIISPSLKALIKFPDNNSESDEAFLIRCFHPDDHSKYKAELQKFIDSENPFFENEFRLVPSEGEIIYLQSRATKHSNAETGEVRLYGTFVNVTSGKISEQQIMELSTIVEFCPLSVTVTDLRGNIVYVNPAFTIFTGYSSEEVLGKNFNILKSGKTPHSVYVDLYATILKGEAWSGEFLNKTKEGLEYIESTIVNPIFNEYNEVNRFLAITDNISEKRRLEEELHENMLRLNLVIKGSNDAPWDWNLVTRDLYYSPQWFRQLGYTEKDFPAGTDAWSLCIHPEEIEPVRASFAKAIKGSTDSYEFEYRLRHRDGHYIPILSRGYITRDLDGAATRVTGTDMNLTQLKETETKLNQQNQQLKELVATRDKFFKIIAHDLRNPFNSILGLTDLIRTYQDNMDKEKILLFVKSIQSTGLNTYKLLENLLVWAQMQTGDIQFQPNVLELEKLFSDVISLTESLMQEKNIEIESHVPEHLKTRADLRMVETVLRNLVTNAAKYTPKGGKIILEAVQKLDKVEISVRDNGIGMNEEVLSQLFKISERNSRAGTEKEQGTGLGLLLCKEFLAKHQESLRIESEEGKGSKFTFYLPFVEV